MLTLKLLPNEFRGMITYLRISTEGQDQLHLAYQSVQVLVMMHYLATWKAHRLIAWLQRRPDREYKLSLPLTVAKVLHGEMQSAVLTNLQQLFLNKLDHSIVNYRNPHAEVHVIGELIRPA